MAQHIGIIKINERGEMLERLEINFADVVNVLEEIDSYKDKYPWIGTIDPYGDTIFNHIQIPFVIEDLKKLQKDVRELISEEDSIDKSISFLEKFHAYEYIKFIGD